MVPTLPPFRLLMRPPIPAVRPPIPAVRPPTRLRLLHLHFRFRILINPFKICFI